MTQTQKPEITANAIYKVTDKVTHETCWYVPSDSKPGVYYKVCWSREATRWTCTCKAGQYGQACNHEHAAQVSIVVNKEQELLARSQEPYLPPLPTDQKGLLHSASGKAFSLLK